MSKADGWTAEAAREVLHRNAPSQTALKLGSITAKPGSDYADSMQPRETGPQSREQNSKRLQPDAEGWYELVIPGEPRVWKRTGEHVIPPKNAPRCRACGQAKGKPRVIHFVPSETESFQSLVANGWKAAGGPYLTGRLEAEVIFFQTTFKNGNLRNGDWDNFGGNVSDALNTVAYPDDKMWRRTTIVLESDNHTPRTVIRLREAPL